MIKNSTKMNFIYSLVFKDFIWIKLTQSATVKLSKVKRLPNRAEPVNFEVRFDRTEIFKKKHKNNKKIRVRFAVTKSN